MVYRLLVDLDAIAVLDTLPKSARMRLLGHFVKLRSAPDQFSDYHGRDGVGRRIEISVFFGYAIHYWIDSADRHVRVLAINMVSR